MFEALKSTETLLKNLRNWLLETQLKYNPFAPRGEQPEDRAFIEAMSDDDLLRVSAFWIGEFTNDIKAGKRNRNTTTRAYWHYTQGSELLGEIYRRMGLMP